MFGNFNFDKETYAVGDILTARFVKPDVSDVMIVFCYNGRMEYHAGPVAAITVTEEMLPQIQARAIFFDKSKSYFVNGLYRSINYDIGACAMTEMSVTADKEVYSPGEDAVITVRAPELGGGAALVSIVDEACLSLGDNAPDIASYFRSAGYYTSSSVYSFMNSGYPYSPDNTLKHLGFLYAFADLPVTPASGALPTLNGLEDDGVRDAAEPGATAAEKNAFYVRENFADNPVFSVVRLNAEGEGTLVCKVPDNITSWRITAIAVLNGGSISGIKAAQCVSDTVCTLPFFVRAEICSRYVLGDDVAISAHCFGSGAKGEVAYTAVLCDTDGETLDTITASGEAGVFTAMNFGKRETGGYSVILYAECGGYKDAVKHTFDLVSSDHTVTVAKTVSLSELGDITPAEYPVCVTVSGDDGSGGQYERVISRLNGMRSHDGARVDALAAEYAAKTAFHALTGGEFDSADIATLIPQYRDAATGFFKLFPYAEPDTELTALIADIAPDLISDKARAINSFWQKINIDKIYDSSEYCASVYGLAALGEPVLDILYALASKEDLPVTAQLYTACGFAAAGGYGAADAVYARLKESRGVEELDSLHFENGALEGSIKGTSLALTAASRIRRKDAVAMTRWLASIPNAHSESGDLALAAFIRFFLPAGEIDTRTVNYTLADGVTRQAQLGYGKKLTLTLYKDDFESLSLENCDGALISVRYGGALSELGKEYDTGRIKVEKYCYPNQMRLIISGVTSLVDETLCIEDLLPTGTRFVSAERILFSAGNVSGGSLRAGAGQELTGYIYVHNKDASPDAGDYCEEYAFRVEIVCLYRTAIPGEYAVVPALVRSLCTGEYAVSQSGDTRIIE